MDPSMDTSFDTAAPDGSSDHLGFGAPHRRFRRSSRDRKMAGVAGGIGRALGVDPVLIRIAFAVLTIFGGAGIALYALGWSLMPAESDEVSGVESLLGRGRSSMSPVLAVILGVVVIASVTSSFTWGRSLVPYAAIAVLVVLVIGRKRSHLQQWAADRHGVDWSDRSSRKAFGDRTAQDAQAWSDDIGRRAEAWGTDFGRRAQAWGEDFGHRAQQWGEHVSGRTGHGGCTKGSRGAVRHDAQPGDHAAPHGDAVRPFDTPPSWETTGAGPGGQPIDLHKTDLHTTDLHTTDLHTTMRPEPASPGGSSARSDLPFGAASQSPPRWDPLGAAPFAWDLPEPGPTPPSPETLRQRRRTAVVSAVAGTIALAVAAVGGVGVWLGWWHVPLAVVSGAALAVVALFVLGSALRGRRSPLIGFGVMLALATGFLTLTGATGTAGVGDTTWAPTTTALASQSSHEYRLDAGHGILDLSSVTVQPGTTVVVSASVGAGNLDVMLPAGVAAQVACTANLGSAKCLDQKDDGIGVRADIAAAGDAQHGTIVLTAHVGTGEVAVTRG
ncbi:PspC domain-containing protein [Nakamurella sp. A5-74]|uniref:PspC domain-containing protein n=1 Tax=Nakamurella sp. A5-74 TaxID=3158264 RepID=A0AAU8DS69_9ACTN